MDVVVNGDLPVSDLFTLIAFNLPGQPPDILEQQLRVHYTVQ